MSDFVPRDILPDLWEEILRRHWTFLETEESMQKLEERKKLEGCLKEFLCVVPHDRKFFLPETSHVLRKTIREMDEFTAYKAIIGFESISQYANNLFTKPWRKEYRVIKMYSGFFQHEIKSNLLDAEKLFEAMGYRQVSSEILVLDGPICPDQVTNVSRDAMAAYMECQIIKHIYSGVTALGLNCSWLDVYHYREKQIGGSTQAIKGLAYALQERRLRKDRLLKSENTYATIQHANAPQAALVPQCQNCATYHHHHMPPQSQHVPNGQCAVHNNNNITSSNTCAVHANNNNTVAQPTHSLYNGNKSKLLASYPAVNYQQYAFIAPGTQQHSAHIMSHSRSLEHYNEPHPPPLPHRHSFDHQQQGCMAHPHQYLYAPNAYAQQHLYESPYDCIDGLSLGSSSGGASYAAVASATAGNTAANCNYSAAYTHPYNVSGNRYPLPYNISNQLNSHYDTPATVCNGSGGMPKATEHHYIDNFAAEGAKYGCNHQVSGMIQQRSPLPPTRHNFTSSRDLQAYRQRSFPPDEQLIDFDDRAPLTKNDFHAQLQTRSQNNSFDYERERERCERIYEQQQRSKDRLTAGVNRMSLNSTYAQPKDVLSQQQVLLQQQNMRYGTEFQQPCADDVDGNYVYARPRPKAGDNLVGGGGSGGAVGAVGGIMAPGQQRCGERYARDGKTTDKYIRNSEQTQEIFTDNNRKMQMELNERAAAAAATDHHHIVNGRRKYTAAAAPPPLLMDRDTSDVSYESTSFDDFVNVGKSEHAAIAQRSPTQATKNQDGVGSFESWDYVFQNLERSGYNKDLGERGDLLVQSLDLDSLNVPTGSSAALNGSAEKRRSSHALMPEGKTGRQMNGTQARTLEKTLSASAATTTATSLNADKCADTSKTLGKQEKSILKQSNKGNVGSNTIASGTTKIKSALKSTVTTTMPSANSKNNNNNNNGDQQRQYARTLSSSTKKQSQNANKTVKQAPPPVATQVIVTSPNEWSCRVCTFLNPDSKRICEMCCRSKDFNLDSVVSNTPTCV